MKILFKVRSNVSPLEMIIFKFFRPTVSWSKPLYILSHSKTILHEAIDRDASFLERNEVMDYSLLVGLNSDEKLLVLGIIGEFLMCSFFG